jgi:hypothetical protein
MPDARFSLYIQQSKWFTDVIESGSTAGCNLNLWFHGHSKKKFGRPNFFLASTFTHSLLNGERHEGMAHQCTSDSLASECCDVCRLLARMSTLQPTPVEIIAARTALQHLPPEQGALMTWQWIAFVAFLGVDAHCALAATQQALGFCLHSRAAAGLDIELLTASMLSPRSPLVTHWLQLYALKTTHQTHDLLQPDLQASDEGWHLFQRGSLTTTQPASCHCCERSSRVSHIFFIALQL